MLGCCWVAGLGLTLNPWISPQSLRFLLQQSCKLPTQLLANVKFILHGLMEGHSEPVWLHLHLIKYMLPFIV
jgi:hypothetical protein